MLVAGGVLGAVVMVAFTVTLLALRASSSANALAARAHEIEIVANEIERHVVELESGHRGFALSGRQEFLEPWRDAHVALPQLQLDLTARIIDRRQSERAGKLFSAIDAYIAEWSRPSIELARHDLDAARRRVASGEGPRRMKLLRAQFENFRVAEREVGAVRSARADSYAAGAIAAGIIGLLGSGLLTALFAVYLSRSVVGPTRRLADAADRISQGDLAARVSEAGVEEIARLARGFNRMAERVQRSRADLERQQEDLRALDRLKDEFVATVSHELRTPLTSIVGFLEILGEPATGDLSDDQRNFLEIAARNANRLTRLVGDLLFVAQLDADRLHLELADVDMGALLADTVESARVTALQRGVRLELEAAAGLPQLSADAARLRQLLDNLVSNALKFTLEGGRVVVRASSLGDAVRIEVEDSGIGIPPDEIGHLAERFFRASSATERQIPGTGLGLAISKAIVTAHDGTIDVESVVGVGTTFSLELPLAPAVALAA
jgi:signal transduction histidine kinase